MDLKAAQGQGQGQGQGEGARLEGKERKRRGKKLGETRRGAMVEDGGGERGGDETGRGRGIYVKAGASGLRIAGSFPDLPSMELGFLGTKLVLGNSVPNIKILLVLGSN